MVLYQPVIGPGAKRAVLIGINYVDSRNAGQRLENSCNDARYMRQWLLKHGYEDVVVLVDDDPAAVYPSRENILKAGKWMVTNVKPGDCLYWFYSGHGDWKIDYSGDEADAQDECILPADYADFAHPSDTKAGYITDDELHSLIIKQLPCGVMLNALFDSCHSGTVLDLPYLHRRGNIYRQGIATGLHEDLDRLECDCVMLAAAHDVQQTPDQSKHSHVRMGLVTFAYLICMEKNGDLSDFTYA
eukprot:87778_1